MEIEFLPNRITCRVPTRLENPYSQEASTSPPRPKLLFNKIDYQLLQVRPLALCSLDQALHRFRRESDYHLAAPFSGRRCGMRFCRISSFADQPSKRSIEPRHPSIRPDVIFLNGPGKRETRKLPAPAEGHVRLTKLEGSASQIDLDCIESEPPAFVDGNSPGQAKGQLGEFPDRLRCNQPREFVEFIFVVLPGNRTHLENFA